MHVIFFRITPFRHLGLSQDESAATPLVQRLTNLAPPYTTTRKPGTVPGIPHGGLTRALLLECQKPDEVTIGVSALLIYAAEGDNAELAFMSADVLARALAVDTLVEKDEQGRCRWQKPRSWDAGLMGEELGRDRVGEMYG